jgi:nicotinate-nucleotide adenylyltransferase
MTKKIAIFGGSFNPPHVGHLLTCQYVLATRPDLDRVLIMPAYKHPFGKKLADFRHRFEMCEHMSLCIEGLQMQVSDVEEFLGDTSYTIDTLRYMTEEYPHIQFALIVGSDSVANPDAWKDFDEVQKLAELIVVHRFGWKGGQGPAFLDISSTIIREKLRSGEDIEGWVPSGVLKYIKENNIKFE